MEVSKDVVTERHEYIKSVTQFIEEKKEKLDKVLKELGLSEEDLLKSEDKQVCPHNKDHIVPARSFNQHVERCRLLLAGYDKTELPVLLQDVDFCYKNTEEIMKIEIDEKSLNKIIWDHSVQNGQVYTGHRTMPVSYIDENIMLTQEDRRAVYNYVVKVSHEAGKVIPVDRSDELLTTDWSSLVKKGLLDEQNNKQYSSKLEQLAALRDMKRRRQSYRAKNVHITKKSYTEIIREVISNQMEILVPEKSPDMTTDQNQAFPETESESVGHDKHEKKERDRKRDYSPSGRKEKRKEYDYTQRSRDREKRSSAERQRYVDRSKEKHRDRSKERHRDQSEERHNKSTENDQMQPVDKAPDRIIKCDHNSQLPNKDKPRRFTEAEIIPLTDVPEKSLADNADKNVKSKSTDGSRSEIATDETELIDSCSTEMSPKRSRPSREGGSTKHKKSKHKKKKSKSHKRRD